MERSQAKTNRRKRISGNFIIQPEIYKQFQQRAQQENMSFSSWVVVTLRRELKRKPRL